MAKGWTCDRCGTRNENSAIQCQACRLIRGSVVTAGSAGAGAPAPASPPPATSSSPRWSSPAPPVEGAADDAVMQLEGFCGACGFLNEPGASACSSCGQAMVQAEAPMADGEDEDRKERLYTAVFDLAFGCLGSAMALLGLSLVLVLGLIAAI